ncbi:MAG TPA: ATP-binding protein [Burkholderiaceae bacterium]|nr:ATP-binding protein [Burkholderiaceae bacterium]
MAEPAHSDNELERGILSSRLGRRLLTQLLGCALLPLSVFAWLSLTQVSLQFRSEMERGLHASAKTAGMELADHVLAKAAAMDVVAEMALQGTGPELDARLRLLRERLQLYFSALWIDDGGRVRALAGDPSPLSPLRKDQLAHLAKGKVLARAVAPGRDGHPSVQLLRRLEPQNASSPLLAADLRADQLGDVESLRGHGAEVLVLTGDHRLDVLLSSIEPAPDLGAMNLELALRPSSGTLPLDVRGAEQIASYWRVFLLPQLGMDLVVVQTRARSQAEAPLRAFQVPFALTALLTLSVVAAVALFQVRHMLVPIRRLLATTRAVASGDLDARASLEARDELGELGRSFDDMTCELVDNIRRRELTELDLIAARDGALEAVRVKAEFLTNVTHELRTPLTAIVSGAEILRQFGDDDPAVRAEFVTMVCDQAERLRSLIDGILELERTAPPALAPVDIAASLRAAITMLPHEHRARVATDVGEPMVVQGDGERLTQLWAHLLDNAVKFSPPGSPVHVRARRLDGACEVEVEDLGIGIAAADHQRIFEAFCQVGRNILTDKAAGIGLGLTLARNIAESHRGSLTVVSAPGRGATFRVTLPLAAAAPAPALAPA